MIITYATVISISPLKIKFRHETEGSNGVYPCLASYTPVIGETIAVIKDDKEKYLILGGV